VSTTNCVADKKDLFLMRSVSVLLFWYVIWKVLNDYQMAIGANENKSVDKLCKMDVIGRHWGRHENHLK
jgi:hypothetical protein